MTPAFTVVKSGRFPSATVAVLVVVLACSFIMAKPSNATPEFGSITAATLPTGAALPSGRECAAVAVQTGVDRETRPENNDANQSVPTLSGLAPWPNFWAHPVHTSFVPRIDGQFTGTTDQIIAWGACKWGIDADVVRAMAVEESSWRQSKVGDFVDDPALCADNESTPCPTSFGLLQLKRTTRPGSWPLSQRHTAFNVDYSLAVLRGCFEGWVTYLEGGYAAGDLWGCVGWHYSGEWENGPGMAYVKRVERHLADRTWTRW